MVTKPFVLLVSAAFCFFFAFGMTIPVLPPLVKDELGGGDLAVGAVVGIMALSSILVRPFIVPLIQRWGPSRVVLGAGVLGGISFALYAVPGEVYGLGLVRLLTGAVQACVLVAVLSHVTSTAPPEQHGRAASYVSIGPYLGIGLGPVLGQPLFDNFGSDVALSVSGAISVIGALPVLLIRSDRPKEAGGPKAPRMHTAAIWPGVVLSLGIIGGVGLSAFMPLYAAETFDTPPQYVFLAQAAVILSVRGFGSWIPDKYGPSRIGVLATSLIFIGLAGIAAAPNVVVLYVFVVPFGLGTALHYPCLLALTLRRVRIHERPAAITTFTMFFDVAQGLGGAVVGVFAAIGGYRFVYAGAAMCAVIGLVVLLRIVLPGEPATAGDLEPSPSTP